VKVLLVGNGGREHAIARALVRTSTPEHPVQLVVQAGNPALEQLGRSLTMDPLDPKDVVRRATSENVDLVVVGPEETSRIKGEDLFLGFIRQELGVESEA